MKKILFYNLLMIFASSVLAQKHYPVPFRSCTKWGFVEYSTKKKVTNFEYDTVGTFSNGRAWVKKDNLYGYIDEKGGLVISIQYEMANDFEDYQALVKKGNKAFYINKKGEEVEHGFSCGSGLFLVSPQYFLYEEGDKVGLSKLKYPSYEVEFIKLTPAKYNAIKRTMDGAFALKNGKWAYINEYKEGDFVWDKIHSLSNTYMYEDNYKYFAVCQNTKWAIVNSKGNVLTSFKYQAIGKDIDDINELIPVKPFNGDWGFIDIEGTEYFEERGEGWLNERIDFAQEMQLSANPNPFSDEITAYFQLTKEAKTVKISLSDLSGKIIYEEVLEDLPQGKHEYTLHPKDLSVGIYVLHIDSKEGGASLRVQKY